MMDAADKLSNEVPLKQACQAMGIPRASFYRRTKQVPHTDRRTTPSPRVLSDEERNRVLGTLCSERFMDMAPREVYATLLDEGQYLCSVRTMYRILCANRAVKERRNQRKHPNYRKPELLATDPNQVWSWDITKLLGPQKWTYYYLYVILDIYSRYVVGWMLAHRESSDLASRLIRQSIVNQHIPEDRLTIHSDRGPSMASQTVAQLLASLGVVKSHSRPHVSNDNPFSESQFKTMKYRPEFPSRFGSFEDAQSFCRDFFRWYNEEHYHTGIGLLTPSMLHYGKAPQVIESRVEVLRSMYEKHPERFVRGCPKPQALPDAAWINPPAKNQNANGENNSPLIEIQTPCGTDGSKTELEVSPLTSADSSRRLQVPCQNGSNLNNLAYKKGPPRTAGPGKPDAPLTHPRPGYPSSSCVPAELDSVSPGNADITRSHGNIQPL
jgi:putative transposase